MSEEMKTNKPISEAKCPQCGASLIFDPKLGKMRCEFCDGVYDIEIADESVEMDSSRNDKKKQSKKTEYGDKKSAAEKMSEKDLALEEMEPLPVYCCVSCGAEILAEEVTAATVCPYCQNSIVLTDQVSGRLKPDGIIPFKITTENLSKEIKAFYKGKRLIPRNFFTKSKMGKVTGVYVPFWVFKCDVDGVATYEGTNGGRSYRQGDYIISESDIYSLKRGIKMSFNGIPVDASTKMDDALMDSLEPHNMAELVPFDTRYLAGFVADRFDKKAAESRERSDKRIVNTAAKVAMKEATKGYYHTKIISNKLRVDIEDAKYVLLPVYVFDIDYDGKKYPFAVNGQTGKIIGNLPEDKSIERRYTLAGFAAGFAVVFGILMGIVG